MICDPSVVVYQDVDPVACTFYQLGVLVSALVLTAATGVTLARIVRLGILRWIPEKLTLALLFLFTLLELTRSVLLVGGALPVAQWLLSVTTQPFVYASSSCVLYFWVTTYHGDKNRNLVRGSFILGNSLVVVSSIAICIAWPLPSDLLETPRGFKWKLYWAIYVGQFVVFGAFAIVCVVYLVLLVRVLRVHAPTSEAAMTLYQKYVMISVAWTALIVIQGIGLFLVNNITQNFFVNAYGATLMQFAFVVLIMYCARPFSRLTGKASTHRRDYQPINDAVANDIKANDADKAMDTRSLSSGTGVMSGGGGGGGGGGGAGGRGSRDSDSSSIMSADQGSVFAVARIEPTVRGAPRWNGDEGSDETNARRKATEESRPPVRYQHDYYNAAGWASPRSAREAVLASGGATAIQHTTRPAATTTTTTTRATTRATSTASPNQSRRYILSSPPLSPTEPPPEPRSEDYSSDVSSETRALLRGGSEASFGTNSSTDPIEVLAPSGVGGGGNAAVAGPVSGSAGGFAGMVGSIGVEETFRGAALPPTIGAGRWSKHGRVVP